MLIELRKVDKIYRSGTVSLSCCRRNKSQGKYIVLCAKQGTPKQIFMDNAICGRSGAGKSTLLHIIGCIDAFDGGSYCLDGNDVGKLRDGQLSKIRNRLIGFNFRAVDNGAGNGNTLFLPPGKLVCLFTEQAGKTYFGGSFVVTHDNTVAAACPRVIRIGDGRILSDEK